MDKPLCRICGHRHWKGEDHQGAEWEASRKADEEAREEAGRQEAIQESNRARTGAERDRKYREKDPEAYRARRREYMRAYRQRQKLPDFGGE